ncbi:RNA polymerase sigma factor, sigma-70 family [Acididesulfobacillus acetoxydans]|uniref:RNA polymerase sigma factor, sigma-70 n=1 Tax=Acididesulfobacillus acetoxydans TaxID=1561005 RepID=A0A8S0W4I5_9FIRM|nr:sigma-70 family RNA polymerase sigma factor [Acididesulfobacillus acetoxydans]CAA7602448.1 RNA polymerase sigma factor, sigma-70 family [Acididesulfobacillus acetoxydans]CEJ05903.1 RNA polymerase sigma factor, sigma-70 [Acididesulfobacillus acetoxydans]
MTNEELAERIQAAEKDLIPTLWGQVRKLIVKLSFRCLPRDGSSLLELSDFEQAGFIATMKAVADFDPTSGFSFTTYLTNHFKNAAREVLGIRSHGKRDLIAGAVSLDQPLKPDDELTLSDSLPDDSTLRLYDDLIDKMAQREEAGTVLDRVKILSPLNGEIFKERYVLNLSLPAIAERHRISVREARSRAREALRRIRNDYMIRLLWERRIDDQTRFYRHKGVAAFGSSWSSAVEDTVLERERLKRSHPRGILLLTDSKE